MYIVFGREKVEYRVASTAKNVKAGMYFKFIEYCP